MNNNNIKIEQPISMIKDTVAKPKALVVFAHGAGADKSHEFMEKVSAVLNQHHIEVIRFNFKTYQKLSH